MAGVFGSSPQSALTANSGSSTATDMEHECALNDPTATGPRDDDRPIAFGPRDDVVQQLPAANAGTSVHNTVDSIRSILSLYRVRHECGKSRIRPRGFYPVWTRFSGEKSVTTHTFTDSTHGVWSVWKWETTNARLLSECLRKGVGEMKKRLTRAQRAWEPPVMPRCAGGFSCCFVIPGLSASRQECTL